jgi:hypothetical protein
MRWRCLYVGVLTVVLVLLATASALAASEHAPIALYLKPRLIAHGVSDLQVSGPYVGFTQTSSTGQRTVERFVLIDDRTGKRIFTSRTCSGGVVGDPWVGLYCDSPSRGTTYRALNARTRRLLTLHCKRLCQQDFYFQDLVAIGSRWFEVVIEPHQSCGDGEHNSCGPTTFAFYNIRTGANKIPVVSASQAVDLNSSTLTRRLCSPLRQPPMYSPTVFAGYPLMFDGSFAVAQELSGIYVEKCGSDLDLPLALSPYEGFVLENSRAVGFCSSATAPTNGFLLPSLKRFTLRWRLPNGEEGCPLLGSRHGYAMGTTASLWAAPLPPAISETERHERRHATEKRERLPGIRAFTWGQGPRGRPLQEPDPLRERAETAPQATGGSLDVCFGCAKQRSQ